MTADTTGPTLMRAPTSAGAASRDVRDWSQVNWRQVDRNVRRLQVRIVKATKEGRWNKVQALQRLLTHSFSGKALAVRRVTTNRGKRTPGVDGTIWSTPASRVTAMHGLRQRGYHPQPLRRVYIPKGTHQMRPLGIPTMKDRAMQALYLLALEPIAETTGDGSSYGFRRERSTADAIEQCFALLARKRSAQWIFEGDIRACFDRISHDWLLEQVPMDTGILRKWLKAGFMDKSVFFPTEEGTPQGGIVSPVLANLALDGLERALREQFPKRPQHTAKHKVYMVRYCDDFVITADQREVLEDRVRPLVEQFLDERGLELSPSKTRITHIDAGFDFLGQNIRKYGGTLLIRPSRSSVHSLLRRVRDIIRESGRLETGELIQRLNPIIRGWAQYHRHVVSKVIFSSVDHHVWKALWGWAKRRHPEKSAAWRRKKYFRQHGRYSWAFTARVTMANGKRRDLWLFRAETVRIRRHPAIRQAANPFDPDWSEYFRLRQVQLRRPSDDGRLTPSSSRHLAERRNEALSRSGQRRGLSRMR